MNLEKQNKSDDDIKKNKFTANNRYFTICIYTMFVIFFGAIIINLITSWNTTLKNIEKGSDAVYHRCSDCLHTEPGSCPLLQTVP